MSHDILKMTFYSYAATTVALELLLLGLHRLRITICGILSVVNSMSVVGGFCLFLMWSPRKTHTFSIGIGCGDLAGQFITLVPAPSRKPVDTLTV